MLFALARLGVGTLALLLLLFHATTRILGTQASLPLLFHRRVALRLLAFGLFPAMFGGLLLPQGFLFPGLALRGLLPFPRLLLLLPLCFPFPGLALRGLLPILRLLLLAELLLHVRAVLLLLALLFLHPLLPGIRLLAGFVRARVGAAGWNRGSVATRRWPGGPRPWTGGAGRYGRS